MLPGLCIAALLIGLLGCSPLPGRTVDPMAPALWPGVEDRERPREAWRGRYHDSRGGGEISVRLTVEKQALSGTWEARRGQAGHFAGTLAADGHTLVFTLQGSKQACPVALAGRGVYREDRIKGTYTGSDCHSPITQGRLELRRP